MKYPHPEFDGTHVNFGADSDEALMAALTRKDENALRKLYDRYHRVLHAVISRVIYDSAEADDVLQEVFIEIWKRADNYSSEKGRPLGWLITLARRRAIDRVRQLSSYKGATDRYEAECRHRQGQFEQQHPVENAASQEDLRLYLTMLLHRLPENQKLVVEKAYLDGLSQRQIASSMQIPLGTVKTRIELGLKKLSHAAAGARDRIE